MPETKFQPSRDSHNQKQIKACEKALKEQGLKPKQARKIALLVTKGSMTNEEQAYINLVYKEWLEEEERLEKENK